MCTDVKILIGRGYNSRVAGSTDPDAWRLWCVWQTLLTLQNFWLTRFCTFTNYISVLTNFVLDFSDLRVNLVNRKAYKYITMFLMTLTLLIQKFGEFSDFAKNEDKLPSAWIWQQYWSTLLSRFPNDFGKGTMTMRKTCTTKHDWSVVIQSLFYHGLMYIDGEPPVKIKQNRNRGLIINCISFNNPTL